MGHVGILLGCDIFTISRLGHSKEHFFMGRQAIQPSDLLLSLSLYGALQALKGLRAAAGPARGIHAAFTILHPQRRGFGDVSSLLTLTALANPAI